jgi:hypothetical protein
MSILANLPSAGPTASLTASDHGASGGPTLLVIILVVLGVLWVLSFLVQRPTVFVVEQQSTGGLFGLVAVLILVLLFFVVIAPSSGLT